MLSRNQLKLLSESDRTSRLDALLGELRQLSSRTESSADPGYGYKSLGSGGGGAPSGGPNKFKTTRPKTPAPPAK